MSPASSADFETVANVPYSTWVSRIQLLPKTTVTEMIEDDAALGIAHDVEALIDGYLDDGQPGAVAIYLYLLRQIKRAGVLNCSGLKVLFEPKSVQGQCKCGDLMVRYQAPDTSADPVALVLLEFRVRKHLPHSSFKTFATFMQRTPTLPDCSQLR